MLSTCWRRGALRSAIPLPREMTGVSFLAWPGWGELIFVVNSRFSEGWFDRTWSSNLRSRSHALSWRVSFSDDSKNSSSHTSHFHATGLVRVNSNWGLFSMLTTPRNRWFNESPKWTITLALWPTPSANSSGEPVAIVWIHSPLFETVNLVRAWRDPFSRSSAPVTVD